MLREAEGKVDLPPPPSPPQLLNRPKMAWLLWLLQFHRIPINTKWKAVEILLAPNVLIKGSPKEPKNSQNEGVPPSQPGGGLSQFVEGWKHKTNDPYISSNVAKG